MGAADAVHPSDQLLQLYGLGKLDDRSADSLNMHLEGCAACQRRVAELSSDDYRGKPRKVQFRSGKSANSRSPSGESLASTPHPVGPAALADTLPAELVDHPDYEIVRELGRGGMGVVYLAQNRLMGRMEVLKVVGRHLIERPGVFDRFLREIRSAAKLRHANIVTAHSALRLGESLMLAMEYVEGPDLAKMVETKGPLPITHACYFIYQAALGLQHAHERGMVHRDIKPANLILARDGKKTVVKVLDFGLAKVTSEGQTDSGLTREGQMLGTPDYIAPEQIRSAQSADVRADIYSLGCTFYHLLTGAPPFRGDHLWDIYQAHFSMDAQPLNLVRPEVPVELAVLIAKMLAKDPNKRFQVPSDVAQALVPFFKPGPTYPAGSSAEVPGMNPMVASAETAGMSPAPGHPAATSGVRPIAQADSAPSSAERASWESLINPKRTEHSTATAKARLQAPPTSAPIRRPAWASWALVATVFLLTVSALTFIVVGRPKAPETKQIALDAIEQKITAPSFAVALESPKPNLIPDKETKIGTPPPSVVLASVTAEPTVVVKTNTRQADTVARTETSTLPPVVEPEVKLQEALAREPEQQFRPLFNGRDLSSWVGFSKLKKVDVEKVARVSGGEVVIIPTKDGGGLRTTQAFKNFAVRFEFRIPVNAQVDGFRGGVMIQPDSGEGLGYAQGIECVIHPTESGHLRAMGGPTLKNAQKRGSREMKPRIVDTVRPGGEWNRVDISCVGTRITYALNGRELNRAESLRPISGWFCLMNQGSPVHFRNIEICQLEGAKQEADEVGPVGFRPLFNGKDRTGWIVECGPTENWKVEHGEIVVIGPGDPRRVSYLLTEEIFTDFRLRFEWQFSGPIDSGVVLRGAPGESRGDLWRPLRVKIYDKPTSGAQTGSLFWTTKPVPETMLLHAPPRIGLAGSWNSMGIELRGQNLRVWVNDGEVLGADLAELAGHPDALPGVGRRSGRIGFMSFIGTMRFRNIEIKELTRTPRNMR